MTVFSNLRYRAGTDTRGCGDLLLPDRPLDAQAVMLIHGGGWQHRDKQSMSGVARWLGNAGFGVFTPNYRLVSDAPWPACGDDCLLAAHFLADARRSAMRPLNRRGVLLIGASAGGHLAAMTALRLPPSMVKGVISIAGPSDLQAELGRPHSNEFSDEFWQCFFGAVEVTPTMRRDASPVACVPPHPPPLLCIHSTNDDHVPLAHSELLVDACRERGGSARLFTFDGVGHAHGIWREPQTDPRVLRPDIEIAILEFTRSLSEA